MNVVEDQQAGGINAWIRVEVVPVVHYPDSFAKVVAQHGGPSPAVLGALEANNGYPLLATLPFYLLSELLVAGHIRHRRAIRQPEVLTRQEPDEGLAGSGGEVDCSVARGCLEARE